MATKRSASPPLSLITVSDDECGYCLESGTRRADPRQLPCGHSFCLVCLKNDYEKIKAVRCPVCRKFLSIDCELDDLPLSSSTETESSLHTQQMCDSCSSANPAEGRAAVTHCSQCQGTLCEKHDKVHGELWSNHKTTTIAEYEEQKPARESMMCREHKRYPVTTGCKVCHGIFCNVCCFNEHHKACPKSSASFGHEFDVLESLAQKAKEDVQETLTTLQLKKDEFCKVEKELIKIIDVLNETKETTLKEIDSAKETQVKKLKLVIKEYDDMKEIYLTRMTEIRTQAEGFANQVTVKQTQLDRGIEQGRELHESSLSEAEVMRQKEAMMCAADDLHSITIPLFEVKNSLKLAEKDLLVLSDSSVDKELVDIPLTFFFNDRGLVLSQVQVKDILPTTLKFCHNVTNFGNAYKLLDCNAVCLGDSGDSLFYIYKNSYGQDFVVKTPTSNLTNGYKSELSISGCQSLKVLGNRLLVRHYYSPILSSVSHDTPSLEVETKLEKSSIGTAHTPNWAVTSSEAIIFPNAQQQSESIWSSYVMFTSQQPKLLAWNPVSEETREIVPKFSGPTTVTDMTDGPGDTVLLFCKQVVMEKGWDFYQPDQPAKTSKDFLALVDVVSGNIMWQRIIQPKSGISAPRVIISQDFFYCIKQATNGTSRVCVEIINALTGHTVRSELRINNLPFQYDQLKHANIVERRDGSRRLMLILKGGLAVVKFSS